MLESGKKYSLSHLLVFPFRCAPAASAGILLLSLLNAGLPALNVIATTTFINRALRIASIPGSKENILLPLLAIGGLLVYAMLAGNLRQFLVQDITLKLRRTLCASVIEKQAKLKYEYIENKETWELITRMSQAEDSAYAKKIETRVGNGYSDLLDVISMLVSFISVVAIIAAYSFWIAIMLFAFCVPISIISFRSGKKQYDMNKEHIDSLNRQRYIFDVMAARDYAEERSFFGYIEYLLTSFEYYHDICRRNFIRFFRRQMIDSKIIGVAMSVALGIVFVALLWPVSTGVMSAGAMIALVLAMITMTNSMSGRLNQLIYGIANNREFFKDFTAFASLEETPGATDLSVRNQRFEKLEFQNVSFRYPNTEKYILRDVSFVIENGRHYSFVGINGAGKTTITKLITGLYDNYEGKIFIDGEEIRGIPGDRLKGYTACVFQDFARYQISIEDNIGIGAAGLPDREKRIERAVDAVGLRGVVEQMPKGLKQQLGRLDKDGQEISGGQWQRVALARAIVNPAPLRILDEPTAALDPIEESHIYMQFEEISRGIATIFISHRLGSTKLADEIFVIEGGTVAERGSHEELMQKAGVYAEMYESQRGWYQ